MEMVSIVRRGMGGFDAAGVPLGYREMLVGGDVTDSNTGADQVASVNEPGVTLLRPGPVQANIEVKQEVRGLGILAVSLGGMIVLVAVASIVIVLKAQKSMTRFTSLAVLCVIAAAWRHASMARTGRRTCTTTAEAE